jgi:hypothetical protein
VGRERFRREAGRTPLRNAAGGQSVKHKEQQRCSSRTGPQRQLLWHYSPSFRFAAKDLPKTLGLERRAAIAA